MEKEIKDEFKNERTLSDILGIPAENRIVGAAILGYAKDPSKLVVKQRKADFITIK